MHIKQNHPYKIAGEPEKRYAAHYHIDPLNCLIDPLRLFGSEASCDIRWEDDNGEVQSLQNKFFVCDNFVPLNGMLEPALADLWNHYYNSNLHPSTTVPPGSQAI